VTSVPAEADLPLVGLLRRGEAPPIAAEDLFARAEAHGLSGVIRDAWQKTGRELPPRLGAELEARAVARQLDHDAHLALLGKIDAALATAAIPAVVLKGPLFAERYYAHPAARGTSDVDLLVEERRVEDTVAALEPLGFRVADEEHAAWSRREHHHILLVHPHALPLELHFRAYRGFGETLPAEPLVARGRPAGEGFRALRVLASEDELVYLAVHAAAHRFGRLAWLYDIALLLETMPDDALERAAARARDWGYARALAMAGLLLVDVLGVDRARVRPLGRVDPARAPILRAVVGEPRSAVLRSATRFVYTALLADSPRASLRYAGAASLRHLRRVVVGRER
jgi:hypothetical protein